jgi:hypothetical protein
VKLGDRVKGGETILAKVLSRKLPSTPKRENTGAFR